MNILKVGGFVVLFGLASSLASFAQPLIGYFSVNAGDRQLGTIDPTDGTVAFLGSPLGGGSPISSAGGKGAFNFSGNTYYFVGRPSGGSNSIYSVNATTGAGSAQVLTQSPVNGLEFDDDESVLFAIIGTVSGGKRFGTINPTNGTVTIVGSDLNGGNPVAPVDDATGLDATGNRLFFAGIPSGGSLSVYTINTGTGAATVATLSVQNIIGMEYDEPAGVLYGVFRIPSEGAQIGTINPATGAVTLLSSPNPGAIDISASTGATAINLAGDEIYLAATPTAGSPSVFTFSLPSGTSSVQTLSQSGNAIFGMEFAATGVPVELFSISVE